MSFSVTLAQSGSTVTGSGQASGPGGAVALTVSNGTFAPPAVSLTLNAQGYQPMNFSGTQSQAQNQIIGSLNGSGFQNDVLVLTRQ